MKTKFSAVNEISRNVMNEAIAISGRHLKKYGMKKMKGNEFDALFKIRAS